MLLRLSLFFLLLSSSSVFSLYSQRKLGQSSQSVKTVLSFYEEGKDVELTKNPFNGDEDFSSYASRFYLYYYRALGFYFESLSYKKNKQEKKEEESLKKARVDIGRALLSPYGEKEKAAFWQDNILLALIVHAYKNQEFSKAENIALESLDLASNSAKPDILRYLKKIYKALGKKDRLIETKAIFKKRKIEVMSETYVVKNITSLLLRAKKYFYSREADLILERMIQIYPKIKRKAKRSRSEKTFLRGVEKNFRLFKAEQMLKVSKFLWKKSKYSFAHFVLDKAINLHKDHKLYPEILFTKVGFYEEERKYRSAKKILDKLIEGSSGTKYHEKALYRKAFIEHFYLRKNAKKLFEKYLLKYPDGSYSTVSKYYVLSYQIKRSGKFSKKLKAEIKNFFSINPINYYSLLLGREYPKIYNPVLQNFLNSSSWKKNESIPLNDLVFEVRGYAACFNELKKLDLYEDAGAVLLKIRALDSSYETQVFLVKAFEEIKKLDGLVIQSMILFSRYSDGRNFSILKNTFPLFEEDLIRLILKKYKIKAFKESLVLSLIRQESAFDIEALSPAGARGLMQLMPGTAKDMASSRKMENYSLEDKKDNLNLGISYLEYLFSEFKNNTVYALSAYNAGPSRTKKWVKSRGHLSSEDFIETIPYSETSLYIKLITRNFLVYQLIYGERKIEKAKFLF